MKNYKRAQSAINKHYNERARKARRADFRLDSRGLRVAMTPAGLRAELRHIEKERARDLAWLERVNAAPELSAVDLSIHWHASRTWGKNPTASAAVYNTAHEVDRTEASASGCGYDKESAAVQSAVAGSLSLARFLIENWRKVCKLYGVKMWRGFPTLDISGKGINTLREIFETVPGWEWRGNWGRDWNGYSATRKGGKQ